MELLVLIVAHCDLGAQAVCCLVCDAWRDVALDFMWKVVGEEGPTILDLIRISPANKVGISFF